MNKKILKWFILNQKKKKKLFDLLDINSVVDSVEISIRMNHVSSVPKKTEKTLLHEFKHGR